MKCLIKGERTQDTQDKAMSRKWDSVQMCFQFQTVFFSLVLFLRWICSVSGWQMAISTWLLVSFICLLFCWHINLTYKLFPILGECPKSESVELMLSPLLFIYNTEGHSSKRKNGEKSQTVTISQVLGCKDIWPDCRRFGFTTDTLYTCNWHSYIEEE